MKVFKCPIGTDFISIISENIFKKNKTNDFSGILTIFPHKRPRLFLYKKLSNLIGQPFFPPKYFDMDSLILFLIEKDEFLNEMDSFAILYEILKKIKSKKLKTILEKPSLLIPWTREILRSIEELEMEMVKPENFKSILNFKKESEVFLNIFYKIYKSFIEKIEKMDKLPRGISYKKAANLLEFKVLEKFEEIHFLLPSGITKSEDKIIKKLGKMENIYFYLEEIEIKQKEPEVAIFPCSSYHSELSKSRDELSKIKNKENLAIVIPEPSLLLPLLENVISALENIKFNISLGFPYKFTKLYNFIEKFLNLQKFKTNGKYKSSELISFFQDSANIGFFKGKYQKNDIKVLEENLTSKNIFYVSLQDIGKINKDFSQFIQNLLLPFENLKDLNDLLEKMENVLKGIGTTKHPFNYEFFSTIFEFLAELKNSEIVKLNYENLELIDLFLSLLKEKKIYFKGHPLKGIQILGFLETRALSFDNVFIFDLNEGILPKIKTHDPIIPLSIKKSLGLPGPKEEEKIFRHHFLHLINSAKNVFCFYVQNEESNERSRFLEQFIWEKEKKEEKILKLENYPHKFNLNILKQEPLIVEKNDEMIKILKERFYSATSLNNFLNCPLKFYFNDFLELEEKKELEEDYDALKVGNLIHKILERIQKPFLGKELNDLSFLKKNLPDVIDEIFEEENIEENLINDFLKDLIEKRINNFFESDLNNGNQFKILGLELNLQSNLGNFNLKAKIDRVDQVSDFIRIIDYKAGELIKYIKNNKEFKFPERYEEFQKNIDSFQIPVYIYLTKKNYNINYEKIFMKIFSLKKNEFIPKDNSNDLKILNKELCEDLLYNFLNLIIDQNQPFSPQPKDKKLCQRCDFSNLCKI